MTCLRGDKLSQAIENHEEITLRDETDRLKSTTFPAGKYEFRILQPQVMKDGKTILEDIPIQEKRAYYLDNLDHMDETEKRLINPHYYKCDISDDLYDLKEHLIENIVKEIEEFENE